MKAIQFSDDPHFRCNLAWQKFLKNCVARMVKQGSTIRFGFKKSVATYIY